MADAGANAELSECAPPTAVFRVSRQGRGPFAPPPWSRALPDGTFGGRFDDPGMEMPDADRFRIVYAASTSEAALGESIALFRPSLGLMAGLASMDSTGSVELMTGRVPAEWRLHRQVGQSEIEPSLRFVDIAAHRTMTYLRTVLAPVARMRWALTTLTSAQ